MSIELLQTMEWSKLCWDQSFKEIMPLDLVLPKTGEIYSVKFEKNEDFVREGSAFILWQPPHSELNGWDDKRPSEILKSYVLKGFLKPIDETGLAFDFEVLSRIKLVDCFSLVDEEDKSPLSYVGQPEGPPRIQWQDTRKVFMAKILDYIYLSGSECETSLEVILSYEGDRICIHYSATLHAPAFYETKITKYYLDSIEYKLFKRLFAKAELIEDYSYRDIMENQVLGAEYW